MALYLIQSTPISPATQLPLQVLLDQSSFIHSYAFFIHSVRMPWVCALELEEKEEEEEEEEAGRRRREGGAEWRLAPSKRRCSCWPPRCALPAAALCLESDEFRHQLISL